MEPNKNTSVFLRDVANIVMGQSPAGSSYNPNEGIEFHQGKSYFGEVLLDRSPVKTTQPTKFAQDGDIVICVRAPVGIVNITDRKICIGRGLASISAKDSIDQRFLFYLIQSKKKVIEILASGSTFSCISGPQLSELMLDIPSKDKQSVISKALYSLEKHISNLEQLIRKQESIKKTTLKLLLEPKSDWDVFCLGQLGIFYGGLSGKTKNDFIEGNAKYITYNNVYKNIIINPDQLAYVKISSAEHQNEVYYGDILFTQSSETVEEVGFSSAYLLETPCYLNSFCFGFRPNKDRIDSVFFAYFTHSNLVRKEIMKAAQGITRINLSAERLKKIKVHLPDIQTQKRIAAQLSEIDAHIDNLKQQLAKQRAIKQGLMDYFFGN